MTLGLIFAFCVVLEFRMSKFNRLALVASGLLASGAASAAVDITGITAVGPDITAVGAAVFAVAVGIKLYKWVRRAL